MTTKTVSVKQANMPISMKHVHEIAEFITNKPVDTAIASLENVLKKKQGIPFKKYQSKGHKHGVPTGYPQKATKFMIRLLKQLKANAKDSGEARVIIKSYFLGRSGYPRYLSGKVSRGGKRTYIKIVGEYEVQEKAQQPQQVSEAVRNAKDNK